MLNMDLTWAIIFFGVTTGAYTIYGGLTSAAWTDFMQVGLLLTAGRLLSPLRPPPRRGPATPLIRHPPQFPPILPPPPPRASRTAARLLTRGPAACAQRPRTGAGGRPRQHPPPPGRPRKMLGSAAGGEGRCPGASEACARAPPTRRRSDGVPRLRRGFVFPPPRR